MKKSKVVIIFLLLSICVVVISFFLIKSSSTYAILYSYANKHSELKISDVTSFEWDCAYIDHQHYSDGEDIKQKYNLECNLKPLETDYSFRVIFFKNKKLVKEEIFNYDQLEFKENIDKFDPNTVFYVSFEENREKENNLLVLSLGR